MNKKEQRKLLCEIIKEDEKDGLYDWFEKEVNKAKAEFLKQSDEIYAKFIDSESKRIRDMLNGKKKD